MGESLIAVQPARTTQRTHPRLPAVDWSEVARLLLISRTLDDLEEQELVPGGKVRYQFSARGHELAQIVLGLSLDHPYDAATVYYRSRPFVLTQGLTIEEALANSMARLGGMSGGRDVGTVFSLPPRERATVLPMTGDVGGQYTPAAGWAQAIRYYNEVIGDERRRGAVAVVLGGDGSVVTPGFWSALNIATTQALPLLFFIEDNGFAISVPSNVQMPGGDIVANLRAYRGLALFDGDGADPHDAAVQIRRGLDHVREGQGPALVRMRVPRLNGHSITDNQAYKDEQTKADEWRRDPLPRLRSFLLENGWNADKWDNLRRQVEHDVRQALDRALTHPEPDPATSTRFVFSDPAQPQIVGGCARVWGQEASDLETDNPSRPPTPDPRPLISGPRVNMVDAIRMTLAHELSVNPKMALFGEDVGRKGGVHGATRDLQLQFGEQRVFDTSLNEEGIIGRAVGMALAGLLPTPEIQFRKYADPAMEQITDCGTIRWRTNNRFAVPMVVRMPIGFSKYTGDPWHSVSGEAIYAHTAGWQIIMPSNAADAVGLLRTALRGNDPVFFLEHRALLDTPESRRPYPGDEYMLPLGKATLRQEGDTLTVVTWGAMIHRCVEAAQPFGAAVEIIDLRTIVPWDREAVLESVRKTARCLIVHEDTWTAGFGAEIAATVAQEAFTWLDAPITRVAAPDCPVPYSPRLLTTVIPTVETIRAKMEEVLAF
jgi:2-oxoisovalerate dehydrogenase E1 component